MYLDEKIRDTVQCCEVTELILLISQVVTRRHNAPPPSATSLLVAKAVAYLQANYTDPHLTVAQLASTPTPAGSTCPACSKSTRWKVYTGI